MAAIGKGLRGPCPVDRVSLDLRDASATSGPRHVGVAITALALGGFAIGTAEFVSMGLLPEIARGVAISDATASHVISAYAVGVVVGAPLIVALAARLPKRGLVTALALLLAVGNLASALAPDYPTLLLARFTAGLPHGAYFGVASLVAASLVAPERKGRAISAVMLGLSVATVAGVPVATWMGQSLGWRSAYWLVSGLGLLTALAVRLVLPALPGDRTATVRGELAALRRRQVWFTLGIGIVGFGGMFSMYTYISPLVTDVSGAPLAAVPWVLLAFGLGSVIGTAVAGRLADLALGPSLIGGIIGTGVLLAVQYATSTSTVLLAVTVFLIAGTGSVVVLCLQLRLMAVAGDAQMLGAALNHSALNIANALGAWLAGVAVGAGLGYRSVSAVGVGLAIAGLAVAALAFSDQRRTDTAQQGTTARADGELTRV